jgi:septal ring factor EnvC (AmiA/AmiB activator)
MTGEDRQMLSARVPTELKELVDADGRDNQEVVEAALWREFGGQRKGALERRIEEQQRKISLIESERNERERELEEERQELEALQTKHDALEEKEQEQEEKLQDALDTIEDAPRNPENPAVKHQAQKVELKPEQLLAELRERNQ